MYQLFDLLTKLYGESMNFQKFPQIVGLDQKIRLEKSYPTTHARIIGGILKTQAQSSEFTIKLNKFSHACGILDVNDLKFLNQNFNPGGKHFVYSYAHYQVAYLQILARLQDCLAEGYLLLSYNTREIHFNFDLGFPLTFESDSAIQI